MRRKLIKLAAELADDFSRELHALRTPRTLQEMASVLRYVPVLKDEAKTRAIIPNFLVAAPSTDPGHAKFDDLWFQAKTAACGFDDRDLNADFRSLANAVVKAVRHRVPESEICRWPFRGCLVSPSFVSEIAAKVGID